MTPPFNEQYFTGKETEYFRECLQSEILAIEFFKNIYVIQIDYPKMGWKISYSKNTLQLV